MMKLLEVQSSVRQQGSISRHLSAEFIQLWRSRYPQMQHLVRDVGIHPPDLPTEFFTIANYTLPEERSREMVAILANSEILIEELLSAEYLVFGVPMYNLSVPSNLKSYLDNVVRIGRTFAISRETLEIKGLAKGKKALVISPSASDYTLGTAGASLDFCTSYVRAILGFIGIEDVSCVSVPNQFRADDMRQASIAEARAQLVELAKIW